MNKKYLAEDDLNLDELMPGFGAFASEDIDPSAEEDDEEIDELGEARTKRARVRGASPEDPVQFYLRAIGRIKLLSATEEIELARRIAKGDMLAKKSWCNPT